MSLCIVLCCEQKGDKVHISSELFYSICIQLVSIGIVIGIYRTHINFMQEQIKDLKAEMNKYNNYLERLIKVETNIVAIWKRIDGNDL